MRKRRMIGPITTIAAVGIVGGGLWLVNVSQTPAPEQVVRTAVAPATGAPTPSAPPAPEAFPAQAKYAAAIPLPGRALTVDITVDGQRARAYACDNAGIETWLYGRAVDGAVRLTNNSGANGLAGQLRNGAIVGKLWIGERSWDFEAARVVGDYEN